MYTIIDGGCFKNMLIGAYQMFEQKYEILNQLNVFPVPDGDTGNNMLNTLKSMYSMISDVSADEPVGMIAEKASAGAIMGARGNSGVILSQIIHGISRGLRGKKTASGTQMGKAFQYGILYAYRAVTKPVEGTILSVARGIAKGTYEVIRQEPDFSKVLESAIGHGNDALAKTPEQLKILKDANVVDAGGQGLIFFLIGCLNGLTGKISEVNLEIKPVISRLEAKGESFSIEYPYCTEFIISPCKLAAKEIRQKLETWGESMIVAEGDNLIKVHIHAQRPGHVLDMAASWGTLHDIKCDNMVDQFHKNKEKQQDEPKRPLGVLAVVSGDGWTELYQKLGCDVVSGGQSMNPSVQELNAGIENGRYDKYILLPNNKNIILAAQQLQKMLGEKIHIVPSVNPMEGLAAAMAFMDNIGIEENLNEMSKRVQQIKTGMITAAVRDSLIGDIVIHKGDYMGITKGHQIFTEKDFNKCFRKLLESLIDEDTGVVTVYYGKDMSKDACGRELAAVEKIYSDIEFEMYDGGQPLYPMFISAE
jgi:DAK2 domain fusion protein YloV